MKLKIKKFLPGKEEDMVEGKVEQIVFVGGAYKGTRIMVEDMPQSIQVLGDCVRVRRPGCAKKAELIPPTLPSVASRDVLGVRKASNV